MITQLTNMLKGGASATRLISTNHRRNCGIVFTRHVGFLAATTKCKYLEVKTEMLCMRAHLE